MQRRWFPVVVAGFIGAVAVPARAADSRDAREREARKACFTGDVDRGVEILVDLYGETGHPNYIYNQARCFERNGKFDQALLSYEDYLRKARDLGAAERAEVEKSMADLRAKLASPTTPAVPPGAGAGASGTAVPALLTPALDASDVGPAKPLPPADVRPADAGWPWQRTAGVVSLVAAGGGLALGVAGTVLHESRSSDFNDHCTIFRGEPIPLVLFPGADCRGKYDSVQAASRMMWIGYVAGGALAGAGVTLLLLAPGADARRPVAAAGHCAPLLANTGGTTGVACGWAF